MDLSLQGVIVDYALVLFFVCLFCHWKKICITYISQKEGAIPHGVREKIPGFGQGQKKAKAFISVPARPGLQSRVKSRGPASLNHSSRLGLGWRGAWAQGWFRVGACWLGMWGLDKVGVRQKRFRRVGSHVKGGCNFQGPPTFTAGTVRRRWRSGGGGRHKTFNKCGYFGQKKLRLYIYFLIYYLEHKGAE